MKNQNSNPIHEAKVQEAKALAAKRGIKLHKTLLLEYPVGAWFYCLHHEVMTEKLTEPLIGRVLFVLKNKPESELKVRLEAMRPVLSVGKIEKAEAEYEKIRAAALAKYKKIEAPALAKYEKIDAAALAKYEKIEDAAYAEYEKILAPAWAEYQKIQDATLAEYEKIQVPALAEYEKIQVPAYAEYEKIQAAAWLSDYPDHPAWAKDGLVF